MKLGEPTRTRGTLPEVLIKESVDPGTAVDSYRGYGLNGVRFRAQGMGTGEQGRKGEQEGRYEENP